MKYGIKGASMVSPSKIFLDQNNPRHEPFEDQEEAINYLCKNDKVLAIAKDIVLLGLNPLELFAIIKDENNIYFTAEGNRRLCAIKLLNDPDLAPSNQQKEFKKTAKNWKPIKELFCVEFKNREEVRIWLDRIHAGENEGKGRRQWNADQKARNSGYDKNNLALQILDIAEKQGIITAEERKGRLSTVQRYLGCRTSRLMAQI